VLRRALDDTYEPVVRANVTLVTVARLSTNGAFRYLVPFLAVVADGLDVSLARIGIALTVGELSGLAGSAVGRFVDHTPRKGALVGGLLGVAGGAVVAGAANGLVMFAVGLVVLALSKFVFDLALLSWVADHVPVDKRGRVIGITETSWAAGLFIGVALLGTVTALWSWRWAYGAAALVVVAIAGVVARQLPRDSVHHRERPRAAHRRLPRRQVVWIVGMGFMMLSSQLLFVVMGPWLEDRHGFSAAGISAVAFGLGVIELVSSIGAVRLTDLWGGARSVIRGGLLIMPATLAFAAGQGSLVIGLLAIGLMVLGFEYAIVSAASVATTLVPGSPAAGIGWMLTAGTLGRAVGSMFGTWVYEHHGAAWPALVATGAALAMSAACIHASRKVD